VASPILFWSVERPFKILIGEDFGKDSEDLKRVNTFYPGEWVRSSFREGLLVIAIASAFGGIHCIGWSFTFLSSTERTLWRVASVSITSVPIGLFLPTFPNTLVSNHLRDKTFFPAIISLGI